MNPISIRLKVLQALKTRFEAVKEGEGDDPFPFGFSVVKIGPMPDQVATKRNAIGLVVGGETKDTLTDLQEAELTLRVEFRFTVNRGDEARFGGGEPGVAAELMLTAVQRVINMDRTVEGMILDISEVGNEIDLDTYADKAVVGMVEYRVQYRHDQDDPRTYLGA